ncbi:hypothetical protein LTR56_024202 [Elasticomyces elasticus]|nr:hypothetical protein LTR56_024202 [Elasticomyces elasticus]KAK3653090.1 hypothetical protein LTR22_011328 [Elasticomyces elasticus]KAK4919668.1 hypothetical protein LTR49_012732 [Elasticomyces elasticus]KAK5749173.1 hypothetical protein LTS12_020796 [Elasticomyces elasticus]
MASTQRGDDRIAETLQEISVTLSQLCEGQAALTHSIAQLVSAQNTRTDSVDKLLSAKRAPQGSGNLAETQESTTAAESQATPPSQSAGSRLTNTFELLEQVLLHTNMETALFAQRVNKSFRDTIKNSRLLQQKLYFLPIDGENGALRFNPLLTKYAVLDRLPLWLEGPLEDYYGPYQLTGSAGTKRSAVLMDQPRVSIVFDNDIPTYYADWDVTVSTKAWAVRDQGILSCGSWRRMYLTQQPCMAACHVIQLAIQRDTGEWPVQAGSSQSVNQDRFHIMASFSIGGIHVEIQQTMDSILRHLVAQHLDARPWPTGGPYPNQLW